ncbi:hypothetical protein FRC09_005015 [Ceratobasidium sp. 395]|nr:hypothetical protein FRC09_005015 [Ceratobasidium sp. 395]
MRTVSKRDLVRRTGNFLRRVFRSDDQKHPTPQIKPYLKYEEWDGLKLLSGILMENAGTFSSLTSAIGKLSRCIKVFESLAGTDEEYIQLAVDLNELFDRLLETCFVGIAASDWIPQYSVVDLAQNIDKATEPLRRRIEETGSEQKQGASITASEVLECHRRTRSLLVRFVLNENPRMWKLPDEAILVSVGSKKDDEHPNRVPQNARLDQLPHTPAAHYNFLGSDLIRRHGCTPGTRVSVLHQLRDWSYYDHNQKIYWLNGTAGTGKTTVAYTFCMELESAGKLAADFFCSRQLPACRDVNQILPAISYQLSLLSRPTRSAILDSLEQTISIGELELSDQLERLVTGPLRMVKHTFPNELVIVIDALDECDDPEGVDRLLECLLERERDLPVKFLITSRPSANMLQRMQNKPNEQSERELRLHDADRSIVARDIKAYLQAELEHLSHSATEVEKLADQSGALFAYAAVLVDSIRHGSSGAVERLKKILDTCTSSEQYMIYATILQGVVGPSALDNVRKGQMILVLRAVARADEPLSINYLSKLLKFGTTDLLQTVLRPLWSVLQLSHEGEQVAIHHTSFSRYILDQHDLSGLHNYGQQYALQLALSCFDRMKEPNPPYNICELPSSYLKDEEVPDLAERVNKAISNDLLDSCLDWGTYMTLAGPSDEALNALDEFLSTRLLLWMEILNLKRRVSDGITSLGKIYQWLKLEVNGSENIQLFARDALDFVTAFSKIQPPSTPHIYISMLPFWQEDRPVSAHYLPKLSGLVKTSGSGMNLATSMMESTYSGKGVAAYSPCGIYVACAISQEIQILDAYSGHPIGPRIRCERLRFLTYTSDSAYIVAGLEKGSIAIWDAKSRLLVYRSSDIGHPKGPDSLNNTRAFARSYYTNIQTWGQRTRQSICQPLQLFQGYTNSFAPVAYSSNSSYIAARSENPQNPNEYLVHIWGAEGEQPVGQPLAGHMGKITSITYSPGDAYIASGSADQTIRIWDAHSRQPIGQPLIGHTGAVACLSYSSTGAYIVSGSEDMTVRVWDTQTNQPICHPIHVEGVVHLVACSPDGMSILAIFDVGDSRSGRKMWNIRRCRKRFFLDQLVDGHRDSVTSVVYSPDGTRIASGSKDGTVRIWDAKTGRPVSRPLGDHGCHSVYSVAYSADGARILSTYLNNESRVWDLHSGQPIGKPLKGRTLEGVSSVADSSKVSPVAYSPDGMRVITCPDSRTISVWDASTGLRVGPSLTGHASEVNCVACSPDGARVASGSSDQTVRIWDISESLAAASSESSSSHHDTHISETALGTDKSEPDTQEQSNIYWTLDRQGWVVNSNQERLIWVPYQYRDTILRPPASIMISYKGSISLDFQGAMFGEDWVKCFDPSLAS